MIGNTNICCELIGVCFRLHKVLLTNFPKWRMKKLQPSLSTTAPVHFLINITRSHSARARSYEKHEYVIRLWIVFTSHINTVKFVPNRQVWSNPVSPEMMLPAPSFLPSLVALRCPASWYEFYSSDCKFQC